MRAAWLVGLMIAAGARAGAAPADEAPRVGEQPRRVCLEAQRALFQIENPGPQPVLVRLAIQHWGGGDAEDWAVVHADVTQRDALAKEPRTVRVDAHSRKDVYWLLKGRKGPPLGTGRHRLVATFLDKDDRPLGTVLHEFAITDCR